MPVKQKCQIAGSKLKADVPLVKRCYRLVRPETAGVQSQWQMIDFSGSPVLIETVRMVTTPHGPSYSWQLHLARPEIAVWSKAAESFLRKLAEVSIHE